MGEARTAEMADEDESLEAVAQLDACLTDVEAQLRPLFSKPLKELAAGLPPLEAAKLNVVGAFAINTLFYIFLKTQGVDPTQHPVKQELERVKSYFRKIRETSSTATPTQNAQLNVGAANRFIAAALGPDGGPLRETEPAPAESSKKRRAEEEEPKSEVKESPGVVNSSAKKKKKKNK